TACRTSNNLDADDYLRDWTAITLINWAPYPPELAELYRATRREVDPQKRLKLLAGLQRRVRDWAPVVSLYQEVKIYAVSARVLRFVPLTDLHMAFRGVALRKWPASMSRFLLRRLFHGVFVVWGVVTAVFFLVRLTGDPAAFLVDQSATRAEIEHTRHLLGLDRSLSEQYEPFLLAAPRGDFGESIRSKQPAMRLVLQHLWPATVELAVVAPLLSTVLAVPLGVLSATHKDGMADHVSRLGSLLLQSMPGFWLGLLLILLFAVELRGLLPAYGSGTWRHLILPAVALAAAPLAQNARLVRAGMLDVLQQDFVRTARAKGVPE